MLRRIQAGALFLDLGCCVGQEIRQLTVDGAPSENLYGADLQQGFIDVGYQLFRDKETLKAHLFVANIFDSANSPLASLQRKLDFVWVGSFLHLFNYEDQHYAIKKIMGLVKDEKNTIIAGRSVGNVKPGLIARVNTPDAKMYRHNEETFKKQWLAVAAETETSWDVRVAAVKASYYMGSIDSMDSWATEDTLVVMFYCRRV